MIYDTNAHPLHAAVLYDYVLLKIYQTFTMLPYDIAAADRHLIN